VSGLPSGLAEATLRIGWQLASNPVRVREEVNNALTRLFALYGDEAEFDVSRRHPSCLLLVC
jgi:hypothetical protein